MSMISGLLGGGGVNVSGLQSKQSGLIDRSNRLADLLMSSYNDNVRAGAYDPNAQLDLLKRDTAYGAGLASSNAAAAARTLGYRPGDTAPLQSIQAVGQGAQLDYDKLANQIRTNATDRQTAALGTAVGGASSIYGNSIGALGSQIGQGMEANAQQGGVFGSLLSSGLPFLSGLLKKTPGTTVPTR